MKKGSTISAFWRCEIMGLVEAASGNSVWRGMDYYENKKVVSWSSPETNIYEGKVSGNEGNTYTVHIDTVHPKKSTCNCAFANGRRVVCKHMIALYFTINPKVADKLLREAEALEAEEKERRQQYYEEMKSYVRSLSKEELQERLLDALMELEERRHYW